MLKSHKTSEEKLRVLLVLPLLHFAFCHADELAGREVDRAFECPPTRDARIRAGAAGEDTSALDERWVRSKRNRADEALSEVALGRVDDNRAGDGRAIALNADGEVLVPRTFISERSRDCRCSIGGRVTREVEVPADEKEFCILVVLAGCDGSSRKYQEGQRNGCCGDFRCICF